MPRRGYSTARVGVCIPERGAVNAWMFTYGLLRSILADIAILRSSLPFIRWFLSSTVVCMAVGTVVNQAGVPSKHCVFLKYGDLRN